MRRPRRADVDAETALLRMLFAMCTGTKFGSTLDDEGTNPMRLMTKSVVPGPFYGLLNFDLLQR